MIVIPMAGLSRRFAEAGYDRPKYMLPLGGRSVFAHALASFERYFATGRFLLIARDVDGTAGFVARECAALGIRDAATVLLDAPTAGQAETVALGLERAGIGPAEPLTVFNIDTFRPGFRFPEARWFARSDGYLEVFRGGGANWSYVRPAEVPVEVLAEVPADFPAGGPPGEAEPLVAETAEKRPLSDLCCTGLYHFAHAGAFGAALAAERRRPSAPELYVAPLYNHLITAGGRVHYAVVPPGALQFCGVPAEYETLRAGGSTAPAEPRAA
ncbi:NTP transferase domain-containing protein [Roseomonas sp. NAR14]|uniref:NTP transferase domain-containing protein n=1 Tax=Roseomonas acroporae TaxID=2937791 RepID=A0A9X2BV77_9PROT|nr:NTP transferase domain-containing protein [Roseomonas acroporae]MCK8786373.1 NTP transferase domain-containing protein [Roseomonas acroporae]